MNAQMAPEKMARYQEIHDMIAEVPKFGNDIPEVDYFARDVAYTYTRPLQNFRTHVWTVPGRDFIRFLQTYPLADRLVLHQMEDMHILRLQMVFPHPQVRM